MAQLRRYRAFISYSHYDLEVAEWLQAALEATKIPHELVGTITEAGAVPSSLRPIFRDRSDFAAGSSLRRSLFRALEESEFLIVLCSPAAASSSYVNEEINYFIDLGRTDRVLSVIVGGECNLPVAQCLPASLLKLFTSAGEPLAADARDGKDGRETARLKIVAGLLGVALDEIVRREERERLKRRFLLSSMAAVAAIVLILGTAIAGTAKYQAFVERQVAEITQILSAGNIEEADARYAGLARGWLSRFFLTSAAGKQLATSLLDTPSVEELNIPGKHSTWRFVDAIESPSFWAVLYRVGGDGDSQIGKVAIKFKGNECCEVYDIGALTPRSYLVRDAESLFIVLMNDEVDEEALTDASVRQVIADGKPADRTLARADMQRLYEYGLLQEAEGQLIWSGRGFRRGLRQTSEIYENLPFSYQLGIGEHQEPEGGSVRCSTSRTYCIAMVSGNYDPRGDANHLSLWSPKSLQKAFGRDDVPGAYLPDLEVSVRFFEGVGMDRVSYAISPTAAFMATSRGNRVSLWELDETGAPFRFGSLILTSSPSYMLFDQEAETLIIFADSSVRQVGRYRRSLPGDLPPGSSLAVM